MKRMMEAMWKSWCKLLLRPGVLVQDRDGRVRRVSLRSRTAVFGRLRAWMHRTGIVEHLPM